MGDFNLCLEDEIFTKFIKELDDRKISRVPVLDKTNAEKYRQCSPIDHIFIPAYWDIKGYGIINLDSITDHKAVYVEVDID